MGHSYPVRARGVHQGVHQGYTPRSTKTKVRAAAQCCTEDMFPSPQRDLWHERLLSIPLVPQPDIKAPEKLTMARSIPLSLYQPERSEDWSESVRRTNGLLPALMYSALQPRTVEVFDSRRNSFSLSDATIMVLEYHCGSLRLLRLTTAGIMLCSVAIFLRVFRSTIST